MDQQGNDTLNGLELECQGRARRIATLVQAVQIARSAKAANTFIIGIAWPCARPGTLAMDRPRLGTHARRVTGIATPAPAQPIALSAKAAITFTRNGGFEVQNNVAGQP